MRRLVIVIAIASAFVGVGVVGCAGAAEGEGEAAEGEEGEEGEGDGGEGEGEGEPLRDVVINEVACSDGDYVELINLTGAAVALDGLALSDGAADHRQALSGTLAPGALSSVPLVGLGVQCGVERAELWRGDALVDGVDVGNAQHVSWCRLPDGTGAFTTCARTPGAPNQPLPDPSPLFDPLDHVVQVALTVDDAGMASLRAEPYLYVPATVVVDGAAPLSIMTRIKGKLGSLRDVDGKPGLKLDLNRVVPGQTLLGLDKVALNNMVQDPSKLHEWLAYQVFRAVGVPAPRAGYAHVTLNDLDYGLYLFLETQDDQFLRAHFPSTAELYEGEYGQDLFPGGAFNLDADEDAGARVQLEALIAAIDAAPTVGFYDALDARLDWDEVLRCMATEIVIGHWDGYAPTRNNFFLHVDDAGVWRLMPWGVDQTFDDPWPLYDGAGLLMQRCMQDPSCVGAYNAALFDVARAADALAIDDEARALAALLEPLAAADPRIESDPAAISPLVDAALAFLHARVAEVDEALGCQDLAADADGDGAACALDCDEADPEVFVGANDACGDGKDNDCNGVVDDGAGCPECAELSVATGDYAFCRTPRSYADAAAQCAGLNRTLVSIETAAENDAVYAAATATLGTVDVWIGADDLAAEGTFRWASGALVDDGLLGWNAGEPNDFGVGEDCAELYAANGLWNDLPCDLALAFVCE